jgi:acetyl-CoA acyltransferase
MSKTQTIVISGFKRSPFTPAYKGQLAKMRPDDLSAAVIKDLVNATNVKTNDIEDVIWGCAFPEGEQGFNIGRLIVNLAELPISIAGTTLNRFCGSSMSAIQLAAGQLHMGAGKAYICGGVESMTRIPMGGFNPMPNPALYKTYPAAYMSMGLTAENLANDYKISREQQDQFALASHQKAAKAQKAGYFADEITPIGSVKQDGCIRADSTLEALASLNPAFDKNGSVTAGTSSPLTDGASAVLVTTEEYAVKNDLPVLAKIRSVAVAGCAAEKMGIGPVPATQKALERANITLDKIDMIELNEAFAAQGLSVLNALGIDGEQDAYRINAHGGAIALGHPLGASGARITGKLASLMAQNDVQYGLATMCVGGGQGTAIILERDK